MAEARKRRPTEVAKAISTNVRELRQLHGLTQEALGSRAKLHPTVIAKIEAGTRSVSAEDLYDLANALEVDVVRLYHYPGAEHDRALRMLLLTPERELKAKIDQIRELVNGSSAGSIRISVSEIASGLDSLSHRAPDLYASTASTAAVDRAFADAHRIMDRHQRFTADVVDALDRFEDSSQPLSPEPERVRRRYEARRVQSRG